MTAVQPAQWRASVADAVSDGYCFPDLLTGIDRGDAVEVLVRLVDPATATATHLSALVPDADPRLASIADLLPGAAWHERETAEMFRVTFVGHPTPGPLLLRAVPDQPPLRSATPLPERVDRAWPGAVEAEGARRSRRPSLPPGVREAWVEAQP